MHYLTSVLAAAAVAASAGISAKAEPAKGFLVKSLNLDGKSIKYVVYVPESYDPAIPMPGIVFLNGAGECGTDGLKQVAVGLGSAVMFDSQKWPFIIVFPQKQNVKPAWEDQDKMVMATLDAARREFKIDSKRIYLTGLSQGGHGTWAIGARHADLFAAIAPVCGWGDEQMARKLAKMPIWAFHGEDDDAVKVEESRKMCGYIEAAGGSCKLTTYPGVGHNSWDKAYREENLAAWFLEHHR